MAGPLAPVHRVLSRAASCRIGPVASCRIGRVGPAASCRATASNLTAGQPDPGGVAPDLWDGDRPARKMADSGLPGPGRAGRGSPGLARDSACVPMPESPGQSR